MKLTVDSNEPLEDAIRVLGALYGVTLVVSSDEQDSSTPAKQNASTPAKKGTSRSRPPAVKTSTTTAPATKANVRKSRPEAMSRSASSPSNATVRAWARQNGMTVSDRGRVPASVMTAYRNAQNG